MFLYLSVLKSLLINITFHLEKKEERRKGGDVGGRLKVFSWWHSCRQQAHLNWQRIKGNELTQVVRGVHTQPRHNRAGTLSASLRVKRNQMAPLHGTVLCKSEQHGTPWMIMREIAIERLKVGEMNWGGGKSSRNKISWLHLVYGSNLQKALLQVFYVY